MSKESNRDLATDDPTSEPADGEWVQIAQRHYDPADRLELTTVIVYTITEGMGADPTALTTPLYEAVDVAGIHETFFGPTDGTEPRQGVGTVEFRYDEFLVRVASDGWVQVYESVESPD